MRVFDCNPWTGTTDWFDYDELTDTARLITVQDVEPVLERNKRLANETGSHWRHHNKQDLDMRLAASIPNAVIVQWKREKGVDVFNDDHWPAVARLLNDPEWAYLKAAHVRL